MKLFRISTLCIVGLAALSGAALFWTSQKVQTAENELRYLKRAVVNEEKTIRVLQAEWDYLNRPDRIESLAGEVLDMEQPSFDQIVNS